MLSDMDTEDHFNPSVRLLELERKDDQIGFHLTRGKWDPYPWVMRVDTSSTADEAGMVPGDCLLEVNGEDIVGKRVSEVAQLVKSQPQVSLLLWNAGADSKCSPQESLCCGPMPNNFQRLSACLSSVLSFLECPVCLDTTPPPAYQCDNGHIICMQCRAKSEKCPICRIRLARSKCLFADQVYNSVTDAFELRNVSQQIRDAKIRDIFKVKVKNLPDIKVTQVHTNKFLSRLVGKSSSVDNLSGRSLKKHTQLSVDQEFQSNLKTKSLSSNEIFAVSPCVSRSSSMNALSVSRRHFRYNSCESIDSHQEGVLYHCPYSSDCANVLLKAFDVVTHFQRTHLEGPLIQYFKSRICLTLNEKSETFVLNLDERLFFLKIIRESPSSNDDGSRNLKIWLWLLGNKKQALDYQLQINLIDGDATPTKDKVIMSMRIPSYSLNSISWMDVRDTNKAIFINAATLRAISVNNLAIEAEVISANTID